MMTGLLHRLLIWLLLLQLPAAAQQPDQDHAYHRQAPIAPVSSAGFYRVLLPPEVVGHLNPSFNDIRVYDKQQREVPYLWRTEMPRSYRTLFREYEILEKQHLKGCCTRLLISNPDRKKIDNFSLLIANADAVKNISLSGSNDRQNWYVVKERGAIHAVLGTAQTAELKLLDFPLSDYRFFQIWIDDSASAPLNILQAGYYDTYTESGKYTLLPVPEVTRKDSAGNTYIRLQFEQPFYPDKLELDIEQPGFYYRTGNVVLPGLKAQPELPVKRSWRKRRQAQEQSQTMTLPFTLRSFTPASIDLPRQQVKELDIIIENNDNQPLSIKNIHVYQLNHYLIAHLEPERMYHLLFDNERQTSSPHYDLTYFADSIPTTLPVVQIGAVTIVQEPEEDEKAPSWLDDVFLWTALLTVAALLGYMTLKLLNDMKKKPS